MKDPVKEELLRILDGKRTLRIEVHRHREIEAVLALAKKFEIADITLVGATEAWKVAKAIRSAGARVVLSPQNPPSSFDTLPEHHAANAAKLASAGVPVAFGSAGKESGAFLSLIAARAVAHGMSEAQALQALTQNSLEACGSTKTDLGVVVFSNHALGLRCTRDLHHARTRGPHARREAVKLHVSLATGALAMGALLATPLAAQTRLRIDVKKAWLSPGRALDGASLILENGKIRDVGARASVQVQVDAKNRKAYANAVATAGFVDAHSYVGASGELSESAESMTPELRIRHGYDPFAKAWKRVLRRGVTSAALSPDDKNLAGGIAATIKPGKLAPRDSDSFLKFSMTDAAFSLNGRRERRPTSLLGATDYLRETYESLKGAKPADLDATRTAIASTLGGGRNVGISARSLREILAALEFIETYQLQAFLIHR